MAMPEYSSKLKFVWQYLNSSLVKLKVAIQGYRSYKVALTQTGTDAPVATVLENTLGVEAEYGYDGAGDYFVIFNSNLFDTATSNQYGNYVESTITPGIITYGGDRIELSTYPVFFFVLRITSDVAGTASDDVLGSNFPTVLEVRVYNK